MTDDIKVIFSVAYVVEKRSKVEKSFYVLDTILVGLIVSGEFFE
jgi:hypothetical protein